MNGTEIIKTLLVNTHRAYKTDCFEYLNNKIDTLTTISHHTIQSLNGVPFYFTRYDRALIFNQDTILHIIKDFPDNSSINKDSILEDVDKEFITYYMGDLGGPKIVWGHSYDTIHCVFNKYITFYHEFQDHGIVYYGALHDEWRHAYESLNTNNAQIDSYILGDTPIYCKLRFNDVFKSGTRDDVVRLIEDAVESPFIKTIIYNSNEGETYRSGNRAVFRRLHYKDLIAWGKDGIIFSIDYDDEDPNISFAKAHIVVVIPYAKLKPFLKYPFKNLAK